MHLVQAIDSLAGKAPDHCDRKDQDDQRPAAHDSQRRPHPRDHTHHGATSLPGHRLKTRLAHRDEQIDPQQNVESSTDDDREVQPDRRQADPDKDAHETRRLPNLRAVQEQTAGSFLANFIGDPRVIGAIRKHGPDAPDDLGDGYRRKQWHQAFENEACAHEATSDGHRPAPAEGIRQDPGRNLEHKAGELEDSTDQQELERPEMRDLHLVDEVRRGEHSEEQRAAGTQDEIHDGRVLGTNGKRQLEVLPPARRRGKSAGAGGLDQWAPGGSARGLPRSR